MSTPLPALNSPRAPDHLDRSAPDISVVPLLRRIREQAVVSGPDDEDRTGRDDDGMESAAEDKPADSITVDGNLFLATAQARRLPDGLSPRSAPCTVGTVVSTTLEGMLSSIPPQQGEKQRGELPLRMPKGTAAGPVRDDTMRGRRADTAQPVGVVTSGLPDTPSPSPSPLPSPVADAPTRASDGSARPQRLPDAPPVIGEPSAQRIVAPPVPAPAALSPDVAETGAPPTVDHRLREPADARSPALPLTSLVDTLSTARESTVSAHAAPRTRTPGTAFRSIAELKELPTLHRPVSVTVPFSSWGPGHQVTATWMPTAVPGTAPAAITLRSSSDAAQRAVDGALTARDGGVPGTVEIHRADDAHDDREKRGNVPRLPEDEE